MQLEARFEINFKYGYDSIRWDFGDPLSGVLNSSNEAIDTHVYTEIGIYHPRLFIYRCGESDTLQQRIWVGQVNTFLGNDTLLCVPGSLTLDATAPKPLATYQWNTGQTTPTIQVSSSGLYTVEVELAACIYTDEIVVSTAAYPQPFDLGSDRTICTGDSIQIGIQNPPAGYTYLWNDASLNPTLMVYSPGQYSLTVENPEGCTRSDTINIAETARPVFDLGPDREICEGESTALVIDAVSQSYLWNTGEVEKEIEVAVAGSYWALASNNGCDYSDTVNIVVNPIPTVSFERNYEVCGNSPLLLSPTFNPNHQIAWSNGSIAPALEVSQSGTYSFTVTNVYGCEYKDTAIVRFKEIPHFELVADTTLCEGNILSIGLNPQPGVNYLWNNGVSSSMNQISTSGLYWLELEQSGCRFRDSINVQFVLAPELSLGVDTTLCVGQSMILEQPDIQGFSPIWQDGSTGASYQVTVPGTYVLHLQNGGCVLSDTVTVAYADSPQILAPFSFPICPGEEIQIKPSLQASSLPVNYLWSNGSTDSTLTISNPGVYRVRVGNSCGFQEADIQVKDGICRLFVPSAFTPNGDGRNDVFRAVGHSNIEKFKLEVFNRWGQVVFSSENISEGWDGRLSGVLQSNDVYVWQIIYSEVGENQPRKLKGTVTLIR